MMETKISIMHELFGKMPGKRCEDCTNFIRLLDYKKPMQKCSVYGITHSTATDWLRRYTACGLFNKSWTGRRIMEMQRRKKEPEPPLAGQVFFGGEAE